MFVFCRNVSIIFRFKEWNINNQGLSLVEGSETQFAHHVSIEPLSFALINWIDFYPGVCLCLANRRRQLIIFSDLMQL